MENIETETEDFEAELSDMLAAHECQECGAEGCVALCGPYTPRQDRLGVMVQCVECGDVDALYYGGGDDDRATRRAESGYAQ